MGHKTPIFLPFPLYDTQKHHYINVKHLRLHGDDSQDLVCLETPCCPRRQMQCPPHDCNHGDRSLKTFLRGDSNNTFQKEAAA